MKRRGRPFLWLCLPLAALLLFLFILIFDRRPAGSTPKKPSKTSGSAVPAAPPENPSARSEPRKSPESPVPGPRAAIIIDDIGYSLEAVEAVYKIGHPLTVSILPDAALAEKSAALAAACGLEIMLHLPFESAAEKNGTRRFEGTISEGMRSAEIRTAVIRALARIPGAAGVNNHTGSAATGEVRLMKPVFQVLKARGLYFIDSRTTAETIAYEEAVRIGVKSASRNVFIDADSDDAAIEARLRELFLLAKKNGRAVGICHPKRESLAALARHIGLAEAYGITLVFASAIVD